MIVASAPANATLCIYGEHHPKAPLVPQKSQTWIGVDATARLSGAQTLDAWSKVSAGVWVYSWPHSPRSRDSTKRSKRSPARRLATEVLEVPRLTCSTADFQRMMRVLPSWNQLEGSEALPPGQKVTAGEKGRFYFDYPNKKIYIDQDPACAKVELAILDTVIQSGQPMTPGSGKSGVTLENLLIEKVLSNGVLAEAASWTLTDMTIRFAHLVGAATSGGTTASPTHFLRTVFTNNGQYGLTTGGSFVVLEDSELSWNNIANFRQTKSGGGCGGYWDAGASKFVLAFDSKRCVAEPRHSRRRESPQHRRRRLDRRSQSIRLGAR